METKNIEKLNSEQLLADIKFFMFKTVVFDADLCIGDLGKWCRSEILITNLI